MKKFINFILVFCLVVPLFCFVGCGGDGEPVILQTNFVKIGDTVYESLAKAVEAVPYDGTQTTISLIGNAVGGGTKVNVGESTTNYQNIVFDFNGYTYYMDKPTVGSTGTETNGFQLLKGGKITFKNGKLENLPTGAKIMIQNYSDLTLDNFTVDNSKSITKEEEGKNQVYGQYAVSNNFGSLTLKNNSNLIAREGYTAFDLWYGMNSAYANGVNVKLDNTFSGTIDGQIEYGCKSTLSNDNWRDLASLEIDGGTFKNFKLVETSANSLTNANIIIKGGNFTVQNGYTFPTQFVSLTHKANSNGNNNYTVVSK